MANADDIALANALTWAALAGRTAGGAVDDEPFAHEDKWNQTVGDRPKEDTP